MSFSMECSICMEDFDCETNADITKTPCCKQNIHDHCMGSTVEFHNALKQDTPCPFCRATIYTYVPVEQETINIPNIELSHMRRNNIFDFSPGVRRCVNVITFVFVSQVVFCVTFLLNFGDVNVSETT